MPKFVPQVGGMPQQISDVWSKYSPPVQTFFFIAIVLAIVFARKLPLELLEFSDSILGRGIHLGATYLITQAFGWSMGLLFALLIGILIGIGSTRRIQTTEGFNSDIKLIEKGNKWFVERVLGENPTLIEEDTVSTDAIQDTTKRGTGSYGGGVQNTSVSN